MMQNWRELFEDPSIYGICSVCKEPVMEAEKFTHPCPRYHVSTGWQAYANPNNEGWLPGFRFHVMQASVNPASRSSGRMRTRVYRVFFEIDQDGDLRWTGGVKPTAETYEKVEVLYASKRPGSNIGGEI